MDVSIKNSSFIFTFLSSHIQIVVLAQNPLMFRFENTSTKWPQLLATNKLGCTENKRKVKKRERERDRERQRMIKNGTGLGIGRTAKKEGRGFV